MRRNGADHRIAVDSARDREARDRIQAILDADHWPSGRQLLPRERHLILDNALHVGFNVVDRVVKR